MTPKKIQNTNNVSISVIKISLMAFTHKIHLHNTRLMVAGSLTPCATNTSYTQQMPTTVIPCSLHSVAAATSATVRAMGAHTKSQEYTTGLVGSEHRAKT